MDDLISRQAAIDDIWTVSPLAPLDREWIDRWLRQLPPANNSEIPNSSDTISRAKAIEALKAARVEDDGTYRWRTQRNLDFEFAAELDERGCSKMIQNSELIEWLKKKAETVTMPGARKMYQAAVKALEAQKDTISRKAAIDALDEIFDSIPMEQTTEILTFRRALRELPSAQPDVPDTNVGDIISRQAAIDALDENIHACDKALRAFDISLKDEYAVKVERASLVAFRETLEYLLPAEPKTGRWIYCEDTTADCVDGYRCDQCGLFVPWDYQHKSIDYIKDYNFCPNCGAKMDGERKE